MSSECILSVEQTCNIVISEELTGTMWIGTKRTPPCMNSGVTKQCSQITSYYWTDGSTVGVQGFYWNSGEPNNQGYILT